MFPRSGKLLNVDQATNKKIQNNTEIKNLLKIIALQNNTKYANDNVLVEDFWSWKSHSITRRRNGRVCRKYFQSMRHGEEVIPVSFLYIN